MNYDTTRRYARSLSEAYPHIRAHCIEVPERRRLIESLKDFALAVAIGLVLVATLTQWWTT